METVLSRLASCPSRSAALLAPISTRGDGDGGGEAGLHCAYHWFCRVHVRPPQHAFSHPSPPHLFHWLTHTPPSCGKGGDGGDTEGDVVGCGEGEGGEVEGEGGDAEALSQSHPAGQEVRH